MKIAVTVPPGHYEYPFEFKVITPAISQNFITNIV